MTEGLVWVPLGTLVSPLEGITQGETVVPPGGRMKGVGADIVETARIGRSLRRSVAFAESVFSADERRFCDAQPSPDQHYAARFAAKEAFLKAVGRGVLDIPLAEIEVVRAPDGRPSLRLGPTAGAALAAVGGGQPMVTLSHEAGLALAFVVVA